MSTGSGTLSGIRRRLRRWRRRLMPRGVVLVYHSIADVNLDPWEIHIGPDRFAEQLEAIRRHLRPLTLQQLTSAARERRIPRAAIALTFDDGYANNLLAAAPLLERYDVPATVFVTAGFVGMQDECWWDALEQLLLQPRALPPEVSLELNGRTARWQLDEPAEGVPEAHVSWRAWDAPLSRRHAAYAQIWERLLAVDDPTRRAALSSLAAQTGVALTPRPTHRLLSAEELPQLGRSPAVEIGAHTVTHPALAQLSPERQREEIVCGKQMLEARLGRPVESFAYPYGQAWHLADQTVEAVREAGFARACINTPGVVDAASDPFRLPRLHVRNWSGDELVRQVRRWWAA